MHHDKDMTAEQVTQAAAMLLRTVAAAVVQAEQDKHQLIVKPQPGTEALV
jgi:hypothetical protein